MDWSRVLNELDSAFPFLRRLYVNRDGRSDAVELPPILRVSTGVAIKMISTGDVSRRVAILFPKTADCAKWAAVGATLAVMLADFRARCERLAPLNPGDRLKVDRRSIVEYAGEEIRSGEKYFKLRLDGSHLFIPARHRLRLQHTSSKRSLSKRPRSTEPDLLDEILDIGALGNRSIYESSVILVTPVSKAKAWGQEIFVSPRSSGNGYQSTPLISLFQWGGIGRDGNVELWGGGQFAANPALVVASDLFAVENYLTGTRSGVKLIVLEGGHEISKDLQTLDDILDSGLPVLAFIDSSDSEAMALLRERRFEFWRWEREDVCNPIISQPSSDKLPNGASPFSTLQRTLRNYRAFSIKEIICPDEQLQQIGLALLELETQIRQSKDQMKAVISQLYNCTLNIIRLLRPRSTPEDIEWRQHIERQLKQSENEVIRNRVWLSAPAFNLAQSLITGLRSALYASDTETSKVEAFKGIVTRKMMEDGRLLGVIVGTEEEVVPTSDYWKQHLKDAIDIRFYSPSTLDVSLDFDALIICGWLGAQKMYRLLHRYAAPEIYILVNQFESSWLRGARLKWRRGEIHPPAGTRAKLLGMRIKDPHVSPPEQEPEGDYAASVDISDFELRLRFYRRQAFAASRASGEDTVQTRFVEMSDGHVAFLSEHYQIPVVTNHVRGLAETVIPQRTIADLKVGDYLLFRESAEGNIIRAVADRGLAASGKGHLRKISSRWRESLRAYSASLGGDIAEVRRRLAHGGCGKSEFTIRSWINSDHTIGPDSDEDIKVIAAITGDSELESTLVEVRQAIKEVRGAHQQASHFLIKKLLEAVQAYLAENKGASFSIEIEGVGRAVVCQIEEIGDEIITVGYSRANRLLKESVDINGADDPSLPFQ